MSLPSVFEEEINIKLTSGLYEGKYLNISDKCRCTYDDIPTSRFIIDSKPDLDERHKYDIYLLTKRNTRKLICTTHVYVNCPVLSFEEGEIKNSIGMTSIKYYFRIAPRKAFIAKYVTIDNRPIDKFCIPLSFEKTQHHVLK